jgi:hypothetical protein
MGGQNMRYLLLASSVLLGSVTSARAQVSVGVGVALPGVSIGINVPAYPELVPVPGYPVYYDPRANSNYFFYDGLYWVYQGDNWYASSWYNGPWNMVGPERVPLYVLRVPVRYYRQPPPYFRGWRDDRPPRWGQHWGHDWERRHHGWDRWDRRQAPRPAPLPHYQRQYSGDRYPRDPEQLRSIQSEHYRYRPREAVTRQHFQQPGHPGGPPADRRPGGPPADRHPGGPPADRHPGGPPADRHPGGPPGEQRQRGPDRQRQQAQPSQPPQRHRSQPEPQDKGRNKGEERGPDRR